MEKKRSLGITIFAYLIIAVSLLSFATIITTAIGRHNQFPNIRLFEDDHFMVPFCIMMVSFVGFGFVGIGLLMLKRWARTLCLILISLLGALYIASFAFNHLGLLSVGIISIVAAIIAFPFLYLTRPKVKEQFK